MRAAVDARLQLALHALILQKGPHPAAAGVLGAMGSRATPSVGQTSHVAAFLLTAAAFFLLSPLIVDSYDEGIVMSGAFRVSLGDIPSRDFYTNYGPAQFYLVHWLMEVFGSNLSVARTYDALVAAGILFAGQSLLPKEASTTGRLLMAASFFLLMAAFRLPLYPMNPCTLLVFLACWQQALFFKSGGSFLYAGAAALLAGICFLFRFDVGLATFLLLSVSLIFSAFSGPFGGSRETDPLPSALLAASIILAVSFMACLALLQATGILSSALHDLTDYNGANYLAMRSLPYPAFFGPEAKTGEAFLVSFPFVAFSIGAAWMIRGMFRHDLLWRNERMVICLLLLALALFQAKAWVRISATHALPAILVAIILLTYLSEQISRRYATLGRTGSALAARITIPGTLALVLAALSAPPLLLAPNPMSARTLETYAAYRAELPELGIFLRPAGELDAIIYTRKRTKPGETILSALSAHDRIFTNNTLFYFLAQRRPATRWHHYDPGLQTSEAVQREMIRELSERPPAAIIIDRRFDGVSEKNKSAKSSGVTLLDDFIAERYKVTATFGPIDILLPRLP